MTEQNSSGGNANNGTNNNINKGSSNQKTIITVALIFAVAAVAIVYIMNRNSAVEPAATDEPIAMITEENVIDIKSEVDEKVEKGMFATHMNGVWTFPDSKTASTDAVMGNSPINNYPFYFTVTLEDGTEVFKSNVLPVGSQIAEIILTEELGPGTYPATINVQLVEENGELIDSNMGFNVELVIQA